MNDIAVSVSQTHFAFGMDVPLPGELFVSKGVVLHIHGWCYSSESLTARIDILVGDSVFAIANHSWARTDIFAKHCPSKDQSGNSLFSGFEGFLPIPPVLDECHVALALRATLKQGDVIERPLGEIRLLPGYGPLPTAVKWWEAEGPRVAICMATYNPPIALFKAQIASLQAQTHTNWVCIITDDCTTHEHYDRICYLVKNDRRFFFFQNRKRQNFYRNFQECLRRTPVDADFIALCDQDDVWNPDKLETLLSEFQADTQLVYSDARVVDHSGQVHSETFWARRANNYTDLPTLMVANTITGAASMFRASLLPDILPLPIPVGPVFHDHWIGLVALLNGSIRYVDRPLYDYIQHADGVIGHNYNVWPGAGAALRQVLSGAPSLGRMAQMASMVLKQALDDYVFVLQKVMLAHVLLLRNPGAPPEKRAAVERFARFETSIGAALREKIAARRAHRSTLNLEGMFVWAIAGTRLRNYAFRYKGRQLTRQQIERPGQRLLNALVPITPRHAGLQAPTGAGASARDGSLVERPPIPALEFGTTKWIAHNISPLTLEISEEYPKRVNLLLAMIDFKYVFGGYIGMFNLALRLAREGYRTRIILHEETEWDMDDWRIQIQKYPGITTLFDEVETISRFDRMIPVEVNPEDRFVATNCWAAHIAHNTVQALEEKSFLFMIQEYEPYFLPMNSISALFQQAYDFPQVALFSTELLRDFFRQRKIGIFARPDGERDATVFSNAIQKFYPKREMLQRKQRRLLFYARPEEHAARNLFELGMIALVTLVRDPRVDLANWSFHGIGSIDRSSTLELAYGVPLKLVAKTSLQEYIDLMPSFDVGLSLMLTPHPSLVPIEMASAGMWAVTNVHANKTAERLRAISGNLIGVEPTVTAICEALIDAMSRVDEIDNRLAGARVDWPTDWDHAFPEESMRRMRSFLGAP